MCGGRRKKRDPEEPADHALGRSRGGFSTKIHAVCEGDGLPLSFELSPGQTHETQLFDELWESTEVHDATGQYRVQPDALAGDKAYRSSAIIEQLELDGVEPVIPEKGDKANAEAHPDFDREAYRRRNVIERLIGRLKEFRRIFGRFEKTAVNYLGMLHAAAVLLYLRELTG